MRDKRIIKTPREENAIMWELCSKIIKIAREFSGLPPREKRENPYLKG